LQQDAAVLYHGMGKLNPPGTRVKKNKGGGLSALLEKLPVSKEQLAVALLVAGLGAIYMALPKSLPDPSNPPPNGGFARDLKTEAKPEWRANECTIERRGYISPAEFHADYENKKPFILTNATDSWRSGVFSKPYLQEVYGDVEVKTGISKHLPKNSGDGYNPMPLAEYMVAMSGHQEVKGDPLYTFDLNSFFKQAPELLEEVRLPEHLGGVFQKDDMSVYFAIGGSESGTQFHKHEEGWYQQLWGKKKWMLYAPDHMPPIHYPAFSLSVSEWIEQLWPRLGERTPEECTLDSGDLLYIPETWYHATLNLGESVGLAGQLKYPTTKLQKLWKEGNARMNDPMEAVPFYRQIIEANPYNAEAHYILGLALGRGGKNEESSWASQTCLDLSAERGEEGDHSDSLNNLGMSLMDNGQVEEGENAFRRSLEHFPKGAGTARNWGLCLEKLGRYDEAEFAEKLHLKNAKFAAKSALGGKTNLPRQT